MLRLLVIASWCWLSRFFVIFTAAVSQNSCYDSICGMETGYRVAKGNETVLFFPAALKKSLQYLKVCATVPTYPDIICGRNVDEKFVFPRSLDGTVKVFWMVNYIHVDEVNEERSENAAADTFILELPNDPEVPARVELTDPPYGVINPKRFRLGYRADAFSIQNGGTVEVRVPGITEGLHAPADMNELKSEADIEPGTWFINMSAIFSLEGIVDNEYQVRTVRGYPTIGYIEYVLPPEDIEKNRCFARPWEGYDSSNALPTLSNKDNKPMIQSQQPQSQSHSQSDSRQRTKPIHVCIWGSYVMDGQKNIYLQQIEFMNKSEFSFTWVAADPRTPVTEDNAVVNRLKQMPHVKVVPSPYGAYQLDLSLITEDPGDGSPPASEIWEQKEPKLYEYISRRLRAANDNIEAVTPQWARGLYHMMRNHIIDEGCEVVVFGNSRGFSSNSLITDTARAMGVPTVSELLNLFLDPELAPSVIVSPSTYALEHERKQLAEDGVQVVTTFLTATPPPPTTTTTTTAIPAAAGGGAQRQPDTDILKAPTTTQLGGTKVAGVNKYTSHVVAVTISPSADLMRFDPDSIPAEQVIRHPDCRSNSRGAGSTSRRSSDSSSTGSSSNGIINSSSNKNTNSNINMMSDDGRVTYNPAKQAAEGGRGEGSSRSTERGGGRGGERGGGGGGGGGEPEGSCFFTVGFVARLSVEKNVGLFLLAAHHLLQSTSFVRFTVIGDGDLKPHLIELTRRLGIDWAVHFTGWVGSDLPRVLKGLDVVVNPSLRAWSETFCIANIEVMSMRIPLVTFAVGGIGEYVEAPPYDKQPICSLDPTTGIESCVLGVPMFSISPNAVIVNEASPAAIAGAVMALFHNDTLRRLIGRAARDRVKSFFTVDRQMAQYSELYKQAVMLNTRRFQS